MRSFIIIFSSAATIVGCRPRVQVGSPAATSTTATMRSASGATVGVLALQSTSGGVSITGTLNSLSPGEHGIHLHSVGKCDAPSFATAGAHINPTGAHHGLQNPQGPHDGDLPNITADASGTAVVNLLTGRVSIASLLDTNGTSVVVHAIVDDQRTDPAGNSGARILCGVVTPVA